MKKAVTAIEITDRNIKLLRSRLQHGVECLGYCDIQELSENSDQHIVEVLSRMVAGQKDMAEDILLVIPRRYVLLKSLTLPTHNPQEMQRMLQLQLTRLGPFAREEVICDYAIIEKASSGYTKILAVVIQKEAVERFLNILKQAGISCHKVVLSSGGICDWLEYQETTGHIDQDLCSMLIDLDQTMSEICFCRRGQLIFSRNIQAGCKDLEQGNSMGIAEQIGLTLGAYRKEEGEDIGRILIVSQAASGSRLKEVLEKYYSYPVVLRTGLEDIPCDKNLTLPSLAGEGVSLTASLGYLFGSGEGDISLMPAEIIDKKRFRTQKQILLKFFVMLTLAVLLAAAGFGVNIYRKELYLARMEKRISGLKNDVQKAQSKMKFLEFAKNEKENHLFLADIIRELYQIAPDSITFRALGLDAQGRFEIQGYADTQAAINQFQNRLVSSAFFEGVNLQYATQRKMLDREFTEFKIVCQLQIGRSFYGR